jgi:hypothetical protein
MRARDGLAGVLWGPCEVEAEVGGGKVRLVVETEYPFEDEVRVIVEAEGKEVFAIYLRVPSWTEGGGVKVDGVDVEGMRAGEFLRLERVWEGRHEIVMNFGMETRCERWMNGAVSVHCGPLVYVMQVGEEWKHVKGELPGGDFEVRATSAWNVAVVMDPENPEVGWRFEHRAVGEVPFSAKGPANVVSGEGVVLKEWGMWKNGADLPPVSPVDVSGERVGVRLVPYGCARLRVGEMPWVRPGVQ